MGKHDTTVLINRIISGGINIVLILIVVCVIYWFITESGILSFGTWVQSGGK